METKLAKIFGWLLLLAGVSVIFWSIYSSYNIFTLKEPVPQIFKLTEKSATAGKSFSSGLEAEMQKMLAEQIKGQLEAILPTGSVAILLNLMAWSIFSGIAIFGGTQVSGLGIKLIKN